MLFSCCQNVYVRPYIPQVSFSPTTSGPSLESHLKGFEITNKIMLLYIREKSKIRGLILLYSLFSFFTNNSSSEPMLVH